jgi:mono/diheme cytochrome c family protein
LPSERATPQIARIIAGMETEMGFKPMSLLYSSRAAVLLAAGVLCGSALAQALPTPLPTRGQLLYGTHCVECHNSQVHWRNKKLATDWASLKAQVTHWQAVALLNWSEADIVEVTYHLNGTIYRFPSPANPRAQGAPLPTPRVAALP